MKVFAAGIATETNTFSPIPTSLSDFLIERSGRQPGDGKGSHSSFDLQAIWGTLAQARGDEFFPGLMAWAPPSGITVKSVYESLRDELLDDLRACVPADVVLLMLHGAMVAQGYDSCEEDIVRKVREIVGPDVVIGVELDLHCHLGRTLLAFADVVITYKEYPHTDINDRARELFDIAVAAKTGAVKPTMSLFDCRMIGLYPTSRQPLRGFVDEMLAAEKRDGVLSVSLGHGFPFADVPHVGAKVLVVTDNDPALAEQIAKEFGLRAYGLRREIGFDSLSLPLDTALSAAVASTKTPVVVADQSDNTGGGAPGDATFALRWLLEHQARDAALAILHDPEVVKIAIKAGKGAVLPIRLGGKTGVFSGTPLDLEVTVLAVRNDYFHPFPQGSGEPILFPVGDVVALGCGGVEIIVGSIRCQCFSPDIFRDFGIDPTRRRILIVKSAQHFYGAFADIAADVIYMAGPGAVVPDPRQITYSKIDTSRMYPWIDDPLAE